MSDPIDAEEVTAPGGAPESDPKLRNELPCGCWRAVVMRKRPQFIDAPGCPEHGTPKLNAAGEIQFEDGESIEEGYCPTHTGVLIERQNAAQAALAAGKPEIVIDAAGRKTRNAAVQPCGCRVEDIYVVSDLAPSPAMPRGAHREGWARVASACDTHAAVVAVRMLQQKRGRIGEVPAEGPHRYFLDNAAKILAEGAALDDALRALGHDPAGIEQALGAAQAAAAGAALPEGAVARAMLEGAKK